jgi:hypothetical protein
MLYPYIVGEPLYTRDYETFDAFIDAVKLKWHTLWNQVYSYPEDNDENRPLDENDEMSGIGENTECVCQ